MKILMLCVNYNSYDDVDKFLLSIDNAFRYSKGIEELIIIIVDNSEKVKKIRESYFFKVEQIISGSNLGYFGGITYAIKKSNRDLSEYDFTIISNVDIILSNTFFDDLYKQMEKGLSIGCIAPAIMSMRENHNRNPKVLERYNIKKLKMLCLMYKNPIIYFLYLKIFYLKRRKSIEKTNERFIYAAHGSFMIFTKCFSAFLQQMEYPIFLFGEEIFIAENLRKVNLKTYYTPDVKVYDIDHVSTGKMNFHFYCKLNYDALSFLIRRYFNE